MCSLVCRTADRNIAAEVHSDGSTRALDRQLVHQADPHDSLHPLHALRLPLNRASSVSHNGTPLQSAHLQLQLVLRLCRWEGSQRDRETPQLVFRRERAARFCTTRTHCGLQPREPVTCSVCRNAVEESVQAVRDSRLPIQGSQSLGELDRCARKRCEHSQLVAGVRQRQEVGVAILTCESR